MAKTEKMCNQCRGSGVVYWFSNVDPETGKIAPTTCPRCDGRGFNGYMERDDK